MAAREELVEVFKTLNSYHPRAVSLVIKVYFEMRSITEASQSLGITSKVSSRILNRAKQILQNRVKENKIIRNLNQKGREEKNDHLHL